MHWCLFVDHYTYKECFRLRPPVFAVFISCPVFQYDMLRKEQSLISVPETGFANVEAAPIEACTCVSRVPSPVQPARFSGPGRTNKDGARGTVIVTVSQLSSKTLLL